MVGYVGVTTLKLDYLNKNFESLVIMNFLKKREIKTPSSIVFEMISV